MMNKHIVKRHGHTEPYDERKLYASVYEACLTVGTTPVEAELIAEKVSKDVAEWLEKKHEVTAQDLHRVALKSLKSYHPDAGFIFEAHNHLLRR